MARPKEFVPEEALDKAMEVFWRHGYEATSIEELVTQMGVNRGSLYETFGDKHQLFLSCLDRYCESIAGERLALLDQPGPALPAIRQFFGGMAKVAGTEQAKRGCLVVNSIMELGPHEKDTNERLSRVLERMEDKFHRLLVRAKNNGELQPHHQPRPLARYLVTMLQGGAVMIKAGASPKVMEDVIETGLSVLG